MQEFEKNTKSSVEAGVQSGTGHTPPLSYSSSFSNFSVRLSIGELQRQQKLEKYKLPWGNEPVSLSPFPVFVVFWAWGLTSTTTINVVDYQSSTPSPSHNYIGCHPGLHMALCTPPRFSSPHETNNHSPHSPQSQEKKTVNNLGTTLLQPYIPLVTICRGKYSFSLFWSTAYFFSSTMVM